MKKMRIISLILVLVLCLSLFAGCGGSSASAPSSSSGSNTSSNSGSADNGKVYEWKIDYPNPEASAIYPVLVKWADWVTEHSDGRIVPKVYSGGALGSIMDCVTNCEARITDGFWCAITLYPGVWPLTDILSLPMLGAKSGPAMTAAMKDLMETEPFQNEWNNVHLICMHSATPATYIFKNHTDTMKSIVGMNVRAFSNYFAPWQTALGATPVSVTSNEGYEAIQKGILDAGNWYPDQIQSSALYEVIDTAIYGETGWSALFLCLNNDAYNELPDDLKAVIDESEEYYRSLLTEAYEVQEIEALSLIKNSGTELVIMSDEDYEWLASEAQVAYDLYAENVAKLGYDGHALIEEFKGYIEAHNDEYPAFTDPEYPPIKAVYGTEGP